MATIHSDGFKRDAVRIALTSGLTRRQVASDLGIRCPAGHCEAMARKGGIRPLANGFGCFPRNPRCLHKMRNCFVRTNGCAKRTAFSGFEPDQKTVRGTVFPANGGRC